MFSWTINNIVYVSWLIVVELACQLFYKSAVVARAAPLPAKDADMSLTWVWANDRYVITGRYRNQPSPSPST